MLFLLSWNLWSWESRESFSCEVSITFEGIFFAGKFYGNSNFSFQGVQEIPVKVGSSSIISLLLQFVLKSSNLGHGLIEIINFRSDQLMRIVCWVPFLIQSHSVLGVIPITPWKDHTVNWVLKIWDHAQSHSFPVWILFALEHVFKEWDLVINSIDFLLLRLSKHLCFIHLFVHHVQFRCVHHY